MKILIIEFSRYNCWGTVDRCTHYYVNGKRIKKNDYYRCYSSRIDGWEYDYTRTWSNKNKDGINRDYTEINFVEKPKKHIDNDWNF